MAQHAVKRRKLERDRDGRASNGTTALDLRTPTPQPSSDTSDHEVSSQSEVEKPSPRPKSRRQSGQNSAGLVSSYNASLFDLQLNELLAEVRPDQQKRMPVIDETLRSLKTLIERISPRDECSVVDAEKHFRASHGLTIPFPKPRPSKDVKWKLAYQPPAHINVVGSYALKTNTKLDGRIVVDMAITMPASLLQEKDYLNYRYFHKRAYYLTCLAAGIQDAKGVEFLINFRWLNDNPLQPILALEPLNPVDLLNSPASKFEIRVIPVNSHDSFPRLKTLPTSNCIRPIKHGTEAKPDNLSPTPFYNASLCSDLSVSSYLKFLHAASSYCAAYRDACLLGRVWLRQRGLTSAISSGGFGHFEWSALVAILLRGGGIKGQSLLSPGYSSYQLFKAALQFLSSRDLVANPLIFQADGMENRATNSPQILDGPRCMNILFKMTASSYKMLRHEASTSLQMLNQLLFDHFEPTFILKVNDPLQKFDAIARLSLAAASNTIKPSSTLDFEPRTMRVCRHIYQVLASGLGDRVDLIHVSAPCAPAWPMRSLEPSVAPQEVLVIGFKLNPVNANRTVDHGPPAEDKKAAAEFRKFWGERAELRRFQDGSILESLVWSDSDTAEPVFQQVVSYLVHRNLGPGVGHHPLFVGGTFQALLPSRTTTTSHNFASFQPLASAFDELLKDMRALEGLPLQLRQVSRADPQLRYSSVQPPTFNHQHNIVKPANVILQFEGSGRWPDDLIAIQRTKMAFLLKTGDLLEEAVAGTTTRFGLENERHCFLNSSFLDVFQPCGAAFRLRIHHEREETLLERRLRDRSLDSKGREEAVLALAAYKRDFVQSALHTQALVTLCTRHPLLSPTIRLVKKWFDEHLLTGHVAEELIELLAARTFVQPYPWQPPSSAATGFFRTLSYLARWDWRVEPLIVDLNGETSKEDVQKMRTGFEAWRKIDPGMQRQVLFAASSLDPDGVTWTQSGPSKVVAARMTALARAAWEVVKEAQLNVDAATLFTSSTADYDFVLHLAPRFCSEDQGPSSKKSEFKNLRVQVGLDRDLVGYDPVALFLEELNMVYGKNILFFHNPRGGRVICGLWSPHTGPRPWKVNLTYSTRPVREFGEGTDEPALAINKPAILNEIAWLGGHLVTRIESRSDLGS